MIPTMVLSLGMLCGDIVGNPTIRHSDTAAFVAIPNPIVTGGYIEVQVETNNPADYVCGFIIKADESGLPQMSPAENTNTGNTWKLKWTGYTITGEQILRVECHTAAGPIQVRDYDMNIPAVTLRPGQNEEISIKPIPSVVLQGKVRTEGQNSGLHHVSYLLRLNRNGTIMRGVTPLVGESNKRPSGSGWEIDFKDVLNTRVNADGTTTYLQIVRSWKKGNLSFDKSNITVR